MALIHGLHQRNIRGDLLGGLTAAVVALPLALAFGNAALGPGGAIYGLYGAIVTGFLAALLGGTPAQVSGPTGPMSVTVAGIVSSLAAIGIGRDLNAGEMLPLVMAAVVIGGVFETLLGVACGWGASSPWCPTRWSPASCRESVSSSLCCNLDPSSG